jgi:CHAT domain-containing protein
VLALLPGAAAAGASLLHVSCHGRAAGVPLDSALLLSAGRELTAGRILRQARTRAPDAPAGLVVLAACLSDLTDGDHDEALTLAAGTGRPADALRAAQLWMLDPARSAPPGMPAELAAEAGRPPRG